ncbi:N-acetylmuramoyl-L-alanine amidase-like domain-containing protein [Legionella dresdenensis]|uniref:N-acetylmuramoyl-L-alanine amidase-like domain-containing protein n=1 Tax=Legionella dresdenensis TaxID=450200 RepID=A0ABV8CCY0_9GAMM
MTALKKLAAILLLTTAATGFTLSDTAIIQRRSDVVINQLYHVLQQHPHSNMAVRLDIISASFLGKPYLLGPLGEGENGRYDQSPLYRTDAFDCDTFVNTVLAIALAKNQESFPSCLSKLRYQHGKIDFTTRNHFMAIDWNVSNQQQGFLKDITTTLKVNGMPVAQIARAKINKPSWYNHFTTSNIKLLTGNEEEKAKRLAELKKIGGRLPIQTDIVPYIPLTTLFDKEGTPNKDLFAQIPNAAIIQIVRPNWDLQNKIGTHLNISHLGFAFWKNGTLFFRQASSQHGKVVESPLIDYLKNVLNSPTIKGINIEIVLPKDVADSMCS